MKPSRILTVTVLSLIVIVVAILLRQQAAAQQKPVEAIPRWEIKVVTTGTGGGNEVAAIESALNNADNEGWEFVDSAVRLRGGTDNKPCENILYFICKRPKR